MADVNKAGDAVSSLSISKSNNIFESYKKKHVTATTEKLKDCFDVFDTDRDGFLSRTEFSYLLKALFSQNGKPHKMTEKEEDAIFVLLDVNKDNRLDLEEFKFCWNHWLKYILDPVSALLIIDVQNDFISGTLAIKDCPAGQDGEAVISPINHCINNASFDLIVYSSDWHPQDHISFIENVKKRKIHGDSKITADKAQKLDTVVFTHPITKSMEQKLWPAHCVQNSWGAEIHKDVKIVDDAVYVNKGTKSDIDSYSAFWDNGKLSKTDLLDNLEKRGVTDVYVCGLAYDVCVAATTRHSLEHGFRTVLIDDACRGVDEDDINAAKNELVKAGAIIVTSEEVPAMVAADDRRPQLGYFAAKNVAMAHQLVNENNRKANGV